MPEPSRGATKAYIAVDLGAESGRVIVGHHDGITLQLEPLHRFEHRPLPLPTGLHWNLTGLWSGILEGLRKASHWSQEKSVPLMSLGVDAWGVDFGLIGSGGELLGLPHCYRDSAHDAAFDRLMQNPGKEVIYEATGIQLLGLNTLFQIAARHDSAPQLLEQAESLLLMPDLFHYFFTGNRTVEETIASTSQMTDARNGAWATELLEQLGLPTHILPPQIPSGSVVGELLPALAEFTGLPATLQVVAPAAHDTASAVAAVPVTTDVGWCYLSSGTWSLMGVELDAPIISDAARDAPLTNERGVEGKVRLLKNIIGLWLVQQCRADLADNGSDFSYAELTAEAEAAPPLKTILDPDHPPFMLPGAMLEKIAAYASQTGQPIPATAGEAVRSCLETLALTYRRTLASLESVTGDTYEVLHIVGGGSRNELLCQMTADALDRVVIAGPDEATAAGNILTQALGSGDVANLAQIRQVVSASWSPIRYTPGKSKGWDDAYGRFLTLRGESP
ncbi:MAG: rhamnulokinase [Planctomycetaceae bacterium]|nr:rhamnulokinase [Planctomycetaceae bacterium]